MICFRYIKFILYIGSDVLLVVCLTTEAVLDKGAAYLPTLQEPYKIFICIWILGKGLHTICSDNITGLLYNMCQYVV